MWAATPPGRETGQVEGTVPMGPTPPLANAAFVRPMNLNPSFHLAALPPALPPAASMATLGFMPDLSPFRGRHQPSNGPIPVTATDITGGGVHGGGGGTPKDSAKTIKGYRDKLELNKLLWTSNSPVTKLNEALKLIGPIIVRDALTFMEPSQQLDWIWTSFQELTPPLMWEGFILKTQLEVASVQSVEALLSLFSRQLFQSHLNPGSARAQFEAYVFDSRTTNLEEMAVALLSLARTAFIPTQHYVKKVIDATRSSSVGTVIQNYWRVGEGATALTGLGVHAYSFDPWSLAETGRQMLQFLQRVQSTLPPISDAVPAITALGGSNLLPQGFPPRSCKNCGNTAHRWQQCNLPYSDAFPRCTNNNCVRRNKFLGHTLEQCFNEHPELSTRRNPAVKKRRQEGSESPTKKVKIAAVVDEVTKVETSEEDC